MHPKVLPRPSVAIVKILSFDPSTIFTLLGVRWKQSGALGFIDVFITYTCDSLSYLYFQKRKDLLATT